MSHHPFYLNRIAACRSPTICLYFGVVVELRHLAATGGGASGSLLHLVAEGAEEGGDAVAAVALEEDFAATRRAADAEAFLQLRQQRGYPVVGPVEAHYDGGRLAFATFALIHKAEFLWLVSRCRFRFVSGFLLCFLRVAGQLVSESREGVFPVHGGQSV